MLPADELLKRLRLDLAIDLTNLDPSTELVSLRKAQAMLEKWLAEIHAVLALAAISTRLRRCADCVKVLLGAAQVLDGSVRRDDVVTLQL